MNEILNSKIYGQGRPMIVIHGLFGMLDNWTTLARRWAERGFEVHTLDLRNHGRSFWSDRMSISDMSEDVALYMQYNGIQQAIVLGHSLGGKVAMKFACTFPDKVEKLIVADISPRYYAPHHQNIVSALNVLYDHHITSREQAKSLLNEHIKEESTQAFLLKSLYLSDDNTYKLRFNLKAIDRSMEDLGGGLGANEIFLGDTLFLKGEKSSYISPRDIDDIATHFPNSEVVSIPNTGHWLHSEQPEEFSRVVMDFLKR